MRVPPPAIRWGRQVSADPGRVQPAPTRQRTPIRFEDAVPGDEVAGPAGGTAYLVETPLSDAPDQPLPLLVRGALPPEVLSAFSLPLDLRPQHIVFLDLETTGLAATPLFLIGSLAWTGNGLVARQYFARDYSEEPAALALFFNAAADKRLLVSFNGKSFDVPYLRVRAAATSVPFALRLEHLDLLHACRRAWKQELPDCRLQTLERHVCGRTRRGDIPGDQIPQAYHDFVRTGDATDMVEVLRHNLLDLLTLAELLFRLAHGRPPETAS